MGANYGNLQISNKPSSSLFKSGFHNEKRSSSVVEYQKGNNDYELDSLKDLLGCNYPDANKISASSILAEFIRNPQRSETSAFEESQPKINLLASQPLLS